MFCFSVLFTYADKDFNPERIKTLFTEFSRTVMQTVTMKHYRDGVHSVHDTVMRWIAFDKESFIAPVLFCIKLHMSDGDLTHGGFPNTLRLGTEPLSRMS